MSDTSTEKKITYLIGAGASANAIPIVSYMEPRIKQIIDYLTLNFTGRGIYAEGSEQAKEILESSGTTEKIITELNWLYNEMRDYFSIDTLAKKFYLSNQKSHYSRLKRALIIYFTIEQIINVSSIRDSKTGYLFDKNPVDKRYSNFIASIARKIYTLATDRRRDEEPPQTDTKTFRLNNNVKIISWNYDVQFELCLKSYTNTTLQAIQRDFQIFPNDETMSLSHSHPINLNNFSIVKLNGYATWNRGDYSVYDGMHRILSDEAKLMTYIKAYGAIGPNDKDTGWNRYNSLLNFAWETDPNEHGKYAGHSNNIQAALDIAAQTDVLVVIGYSFPIFNREIDRKIFSKMKKVQKIYIQDKEPELIKESISRAFPDLHESKYYDTWTKTFVKSVQFVLSSNTNQFIIPNELNLDF